MTQIKRSSIFVLTVFLISLASGYYLYQNHSSQAPIQAADWIDDPPLHCAVGKQKVRNNLGSARGISIARGRTKLALKEGYLNSTHGFQTHVKKSKVRKGWLYSLVCKVDS